MTIHADFYHYIHDDDYLPGDEFDWDQGDASQHCKHGTFIGSWAGPDLLCGWCEDGIDMAEFLVIQREAAIRARKVVLVRGVWDDQEFSRILVNTLLTFQRRDDLAGYTARIIQEMDEWAGEEAARIINERAA